MNGRARETLGVFVLLALTYGSFVQAATWGAAARFDLARSLAERGTLRIDAYHENTGDKALFEEHYYSDKAPLPSFLAAPGIALAHVIRGGPSGTDDPDGRAAERAWLPWAVGLAVFGATAIPTALGGAAFFAVLRDRGAAYRPAWVATMLAFLATPLLPYGTLLQGHAPVAAWLIGFFHLLFPNRPLGSWRAVLAGVTASAALATEYLAGPPLVAIALVACVHHSREGPGGSLGRIGKLAGLVAAGAAPGLVLLGAYHQAAFGSPFALGYQHVALPFFQEKMARGFFGIGVPDSAIALRLLVGPWRGLFFASPALVLGLAGVLMQLRRPERRPEAGLALGIFAFYLVLNAGYSTWHGGWAIGPRHLVPAVPFLALGFPTAFAALARSGGIVVRALAVVTCAVSVLFMVAATSVQPEVPEEIRNPVFGHVLPHFLRGELSVGEQGFDDLYPARDDPDTPDRWDAFLVGEALGLPGLLALAPVLVLLVVLSPPVLGRRERR